ncbi:hypothetical protein C2845_PM07G21170 [Panicum miliaceum]|uniref:Uncharacterized protein n=1 Tax=Panicum miliaceum TaxID=4540 RepID=A0A3L6SPB1_PANMI|nr:hypothetical protein C2845_PM07G21170 [Panicum miliaceum]
MGTNIRLEETDIADKLDMYLAGGYTTLMLEQIRNSQEQQHNSYKATENPYLQEISGTEADDWNWGINIFNNMQIDVQGDIDNAETAMIEVVDNNSSIQDPMTIKNKGRPPNPKRFKTMVEVERQKIQKQNDRKKTKSETSSPNGKSKKKMKSNAAGTNLKNQKKEKK